MLQGVVEFLGAAAGMLYVLRLSVILLAYTVRHARDVVHETAPLLKQFRSVTLASTTAAAVTVLGFVALMYLDHPVFKFIGAFLLTFGIQFFLWSVGFTSAFLGNDVPAPNDDRGDDMELILSRDQRRLTSR